MHKNTYTRTSMRIVQFFVVLYKLHLHKFVFNTRLDVCMCSCEHTNVQIMKEFVEALSAYRKSLARLCCNEKKLWVKERCFWIRFVDFKFLF